MSAWHRFMDWAGLGDMNRRHREWRRQQIALELEEAHQECAALGAYIGKLQAEQAQLERELNP